MGNISELEQLVRDIKKSTDQISINKGDEVRVMKSMLNDRDFTIGVYDKTNGYIGQRSPHQEAVKFVKNVVAGATGLDNMMQRCIKKKTDMLDVIKRTIADMNTEEQKKWLKKHL